jgi:hypothetical protein
MCRVLKINRSGFYTWLKKPLSNRAIEDNRLLESINEFYEASGGTYGILGYTKTYVRLAKYVVSIVSLKLCGKTTW